MRKFLRSWFINIVSLAFLTAILPALQIGEKLKGFLISGLILTIINLFIKPLLKAIFLPINLLTLGTLRWIIDVINLYLLILFSPLVIIKSFLFPGVHSYGIIIPSYKINSFFSLIIASLLLTLIKKIVIKIIKKPNLNV